MGRLEKYNFDLSDGEKRDLITLIQQGKPLPEKYRFLLFEDKREVELVWNGKTRDVCTTVLPFQSLEHIDEPRTETKTQGDLFDGRGRQLRGWTNKLIWGDNKLILSSLKAGPLRRQIDEAGGLKLVYIDPPFDIGADFSMNVEIGGETFRKEPNLLEQTAYRDTWGRGADSFIAMMYERITLIRDLMSNDGSLFIHCDWRVDNFLRQILDEIFGKDKIVSEIIWKHQIMGGSHGKRLPKAHETVLWFKKSDDFKINEDAPEIRVPFSEYVRSTMQKSPDGRWFYTRRRMSRKATDAEQEAKAHTITYVDDPEAGTLASDVWDDFPSYQPKPADNTKYPTQKPNELLERVIGGASKEGELVADFFCGSGTTAAVAEKLGRKWIATDLGKFAVHTTRKRLIGVQRERKAADKPFRAFEVLNLGRYERQAYLNVGGRLNAAQKAQALAEKEREFRDLILRAYRAQGFGEGGEAQDGFFHGARAGRLVVIGPINLPVGRLFVEEVIVEARKRGASRVDVLAFEFEMGLFPAVLEEARNKGLDLSPKYIPAEVFDKRAVDKGQVVFHDISFVEATPRYDKRNKRAVRIELTDFSVYYTQGAAEAAIAAMKEGKSEVLCEQGQLYKVSKSKDGVVSKERLTKRWTDWVDYWAVDFDYMHRKEIIKVPVGTGLSGVATLPGFEPAQGEIALPQFEERWTGGYIFENEWQSFRTRQNRDLELITAEHAYDQPGRYTVAVKVIDISETTR